jgi:hypothetical protein
MVLKLNPNHQLLWHNPSTLQIGTDARSVVLPRLSVEQERFIDALYFGIAPNQLAAMAKQVKLPAQQAQQLLEQLKPLLQKPNDDPNEFGLAGLPADSTQPQFAETIWASLQHSTSGHAVLNQRAKRVVQLDRLDASGLLVMLALAAAGVGTLVALDQGVVCAADTGPNGYPEGLIGHPRIAAATLILQATWPASRLVSASQLRSNQLDAVDSVLFLAQQVIDPERYGPWAARGIPHQTLIFDANGVEVSPVLVPGKSACLNCQHLHRSQNQENWGVVSSQLLTSTLRFDHTANRCIGIGLAVQVLLGWLDEIGGFGLANSHGFRYSSHTAQLDQVQWQRNKACSCTLVTASAA